MVVGPRESQGRPLLRPGNSYGWAIQKTCKSPTLPRLRNGRGCWSQKIPESCKSQTLPRLGNCRSCWPQRVPGSALLCRGKSSRLWDPGKWHPGGTVSTFPTCLAFVYLLLEAVREALGPQHQGRSKSPPGRAALTFLICLAFVSLLLETVKKSWTPDTRGAQNRHQVGRFRLF